VVFPFTNHRKSLADGALHEQPLH